MFNVMTVGYSPPMCPGLFKFGTPLMSSGISFSNVGCKIEERFPTTFIFTRISYSDLCKFIARSFQILEKHYVLFVNIVPLGSGLLTPVSNSATAGSAAALGGSTTLCKYILVISRHWYNIK